MKRGLVYILILAFCSLFVIKGFIDEVQHAHSADFRAVYSGSRCLLERCNPYQHQDLDRTFSESGGSGPAFRQGAANYPPTTFFAVLPIAVLPWAAARVVWLLLIAGSMCLALILAVDLVEPHPLLAAIAGGMLLSTQRSLLAGGQPSGVAIGFCVIAVWCLLNDRYVKLGVILFAFSLAIKPQIGALIWLYFALASLHWHRAMQIAATFFVVGFPGVVWVSLMRTSRHWFRAEAQVVRWIERRSDVTQGVTFCQCTHLQPFLGHFTWTAASAQIITWGIWFVLFGWWLCAVYQIAPSRKKDFLCVASAACLILIPIYHGEYDVCLLFLILPTSMQLLRSKRGTGIAALSLSLLIVALYLVRTLSHKVQTFGAIAGLAVTYSPAFEMNAVLLIGIVVLLNQSMVPVRMPWQRKRRLVTRY